MTLSDFATQALSIVGTAIEGLCALSFIYAAKVRALPLVFSFIVYLFVSDTFLLLIPAHIDMLPMLLTTTYIGYIFECAALWELTRHIVGMDIWDNRKFRLPRLTISFCILGGLATYLLTDMRTYLQFGNAERRFLHIDLAASVFRVIAFIAMLLLLRLKWRYVPPLVARVTVLFAVYAVCAMLKHIVNELVPKLALPVKIYEISDWACGIVWVVLLGVLIRNLLQIATTRLESQRLLTSSDG